MNLAEIPKNSVQHLLIYGAPKTGKSVLAGMVSQKLKLEWLDLERGVGSLLNPEFSSRILPQNINVLNIPDTSGYPIAIETLLKVIKGGESKICAEHGKVSCAICAKEGKPFETLTLTKEGMAGKILVVDSLTQLTNSAIASITRGKPDDYKLQRDDWGNLGHLMDKFLGYVQQAPFHVICISHETTAEFEDGKEKIVPVAGTRNFSRNTAKYFDTVIYAELKNKAHVFSSTTTSHMNIQSGTRSGVDLTKGSILDFFS